MEYGDKCCPKIKLEFKGLTGPTGPCCTGPTGQNGGPGPTGPCCTGPTGPSNPSYHVYVDTGKTFNTPTPFPPTGNLTNLNAKNIIVTMWGGGGGGQIGGPSQTTPGYGGGGGGGAFTYYNLPIDITGYDTMTYTLGQGGKGSIYSTINGEDGGPTSITLSSNNPHTGKSLNITAYGGAGAVTIQSGPSTKAAYGGGGGGAGSSGNGSLGGNPNTLFPFSKGQDGGTDGSSGNDGLYFSYFIQGSGGGSGQITTVGQGYGGSNFLSQGGASNDNQSPSVIIAGGGGASYGPGGGYGGSSNSTSLNSVNGQLGGGGAGGNEVISPTIVGNGGDGGIIITYISQ